MYSLESTTSDGTRRDGGLRFVRRMYLPRVLGLALGAICVGGVLWEMEASVTVWLGLAASVLVWPHLAYLLGRRSSDPYRAELRSLMVDSALGGLWIVLMKFNLLPSVLLAALLTMDKLAVGGLRFCLRCTAVLATAVAASGLLFGFELEPETSMAQIAACLPLLVVYPMAVGVITYRLARRVRAQNRMLAHLSRTDGLSALLNRKYWEEAVSMEFQRCRRHGRRASLLMMDVDHFKAINDQYGHPVGDEVIRAIAGLLRASMRHEDLPGRYGGEEFGILLPDTGVAGAEAIAERIRKRIESTVLESGRGIYGTVSIGIAELQRQDMDYGTWISHADRALYAAKGRGRNCSVRYDSSVSSAAP